MTDNTQEVRLHAQYELLRASPDPRRNQRACSQMYTDLRTMANAVIIKKYGLSPRIDVETITHEVAASIMMSVVRRRADVFSWVHLVRKVSFDWTNKWMKNNLYGRHASNVSLDAHCSDEDGQPEPVHDIAVYDIDPAMVQMYYGFVNQRVQQVFRDTRQLGTSARGNLTRRLAIAAAVHGDMAAVTALPAAAKARVRYYMHAVRRALLPVLSRDHFEREFL